VKKIYIGLLTLLLLGGLTTAALAAETSKSELALLSGTKESSTGWYKYQFNQSWSFATIYEDENLKTGLNYAFSDRFQFKFGVNHDFDEAKNFGYGGIGFTLPFGNNLKFTGFYDYNYRDEEWNRYETAIRIEAFPGQYLFAGVRGETGSGAPEYDYNTEKEALLFMRGDFSWQIKKFSINIRPLLHIKGEYFHDYDFKYQINDRASLVLNMNSLYDQEIKYRFGAEFKF